jgi:hypothetical protein
VSDGKLADGDDGAGIVKFTSSFILTGRELARCAPVALISKVLIRSKNSNPAASVPRTNMGICT